MPATVLAERVGWDGSISWVRENVARLRPQYRHPDPADRLTWAPGAAAQCDLWFPPPGSAGGRQQRAAAGAGEVRRPCRGLPGSGITRLPAGHKFVAPMTAGLPDSGSQAGSQQRQTSSDARRPRATIDAARWHIRRRLATVRDRQIAPEKRKVGGSTPPLTTTRYYTSPGSMGSMFTFGSDILGCRRLSDHGQGRGVAGCVCARVAGAEAWAAAVVMIGWVAVAGAAGAGYGGPAASAARLVRRRLRMRGGGP